VIVLFQIAHLGVAPRRLAELDGQAALEESQPKPNVEHRTENTEHRAPHPNTKQRAPTSTRTTPSTTTTTTTTTQITITKEERQLDKIP
jgi:cytoskeletal protein RodZ